MLTYFSVWRQRENPTIQTNLTLEDAELMLSEKWLEERIQEIKTLQGDRELPGPWGSIEKSILLYGAAIISANGNPAAIHRNIGIIHDQMHGLRTVAPIHRMAQRALSGEPEEMSNLRRVMKFFGGVWGPDDGPPRPFPEPQPWPDPQPNPWPWPPDPYRPWIPEHPGELEQWICLYEMIRVFSQIQTYTISSISPSRACPGTVITLTGSNFGTTPGRVSFPSGAFSRVNATPINWSDNQIIVEVPTNAICGELRIHVPEKTVIVCGKAIDLLRPGSSNVTFDGGRTTILRFYQSGTNPGNCVSPGSSFRANWQVCNATQLRLRVVNSGGTVVLDTSPSVSTNSRIISVPNYTRRTVLTCELEASGPCGTDTSSFRVEVNVVPAISVDGVEFTQGIQRFWRTGITPNSIPTISGKDTIARVYVDCDRQGFESDQIRVTGEMRIGGRTFMPINGITPNNPGGSNPFITARPSANINRQTTNHTLNFRIPAALSSGSRSIRFNLFADRVCGVQATTSFDTARNWVNNEALAVRFVRIVDASQSPPTPAPTVAQCRFTVNRAFDLIPSPPTNIGPARTAIWGTTRDFTNSDDELEDLLRDLNGNHNGNIWEVFTDPAAFF